VGLVRCAGGAAGCRARDAGHPQDPARAERILRAYRLYLAGSAMSFERGWIALHQMLVHPAERLQQTGRQYGVSVHAQLHVHLTRPLRPMIYTFKSKAAGNLIMLQAHGDTHAANHRQGARPQGIVLPEQMPAAIAGPGGHRWPKEDAALRQGGDRPRGGGRRSLPEPKDVSAAPARLPFIDMLRRCQAAKEIVWGV
jgi:cyclopropane-fatty-acyl-phospholipid synthase